jgi:predicted phage tail protein
MITIQLHGDIAKLYTKQIKVAARTIREALNALQLIPELNPNNTQKRFLCQVKECTQSSSLDEPIEVNTLNITSESVIYPKDVCGSGNNPNVRIVIGIVLLVVAYYLPSSWAFMANALTGAGAGLIIGGVAELLNPLKKDDDEDNKNYSITNYQNTVKSGTPIPIILGRHKHGGHIFSLNAVSRETKELHLSDLLLTPQLFKDSWENLSVTLNNE